MCRAGPECSPALYNAYIRIDERSSSGVECTFRVTNDVSYVSVRDRHDHSHILLCPVLAIHMERGTQWSGTEPGGLPHDGFFVVNNPLVIYEF